MNCKQLSTNVDYAKGWNQVLVKNSNTMILTEDMGASNASAPLLSKIGNALVALDGTNAIVTSYA